MAGSGMETVTIEAPDDAGSAEIYLHGAHVTSWKAKNGQELLFVSKKAIFKPPKAIRGGIPVCFPQFSDFGPLGQHGFARNTAFEVLSSAPSTVSLVLRSSDETRKVWPHDFELVVTVTVGPDYLIQEMKVTNTGNDDFTFTAALHTYYRVKNIDKVHIEGLKGTEYLDSLDGRKRQPEEGDVLQFNGEVDRIYTGVPGNLQVVDEEAKHAIVIHRDKFVDAVVWNPWIDKAKATTDFGDDEYMEMVCVEPAIAPSGPVTLKPQESWHGAQTIRHRVMD